MPSMGPIFPLTCDSLESSQHAQRSGSEARRVDVADSASCGAAVREAWTLSSPCHTPMSHHTGAMSSAVSAKMIALTVVVRMPIDAQKICKSGQSPSPPSLTIE
jgi:hypothetical protein